MTSRTTERWCAIRYYKGYTFTGKYEVSSWGNLRNAETKVPLATYSNCRGQGYLKTKIIDTEGKRRALYVHQLVAFYFIGQQPAEGTDVDHIDGNVRNNSYTNLRYLTHKDNMRAYHQGRKAI